MRGFSATEAAFTGFRIVRERPRAVLVWGLIQIVIGLVFGAVMVVTAGPTVMAAQAQGLATKDPAQAVAMLRQLLPMYAMLMVFALIFYPIVYAAMSRAVLRPQDEGFAYLRLGADELRQLGLMLWILLVAFVAYVASILVLVVVFLATGFAGAASGGKVGAGALVGGLAGILALLAFIALWIFIAVRLSLASPLTFATGRVNLFGSWTLTRGRFWPILGTYLLTLALAAVVYMLGYAIIAACVAVAGGGIGGLATLFRPDLSSLAAFLQPARLAQVVLSGLLTALIWPVILTPPAAIYRSLAEPEEGGPAHVFS
jgi:hypothetical protein